MPFCFSTLPSAISINTQVTLQFRMVCFFKQDKSTESWMTAFVVWSLNNDLIVNVNMRKRNTLFWYDFMFYTFKDIQHSSSALVQQLLMQRVNFVYHMYFQTSPRINVFVISCFYFYYYFPTRITLYLWLDGFPPSTNAPWTSCACCACVACPFRAQHQEHGWRDCGGRRETQQKVS